MGIRNDTNSLIFFAYWDRRRLPAVGRGDACLPAGNTETPNSQLYANCILVYYAYWQRSG
jgi:hypothetical protein